jgi:Domain of unknown function (DUF4382)
MRRTLAFLLVIATLAVVACGGSPSGPSGSGSLAVRITDLPYSDADAVLVTFSDVSVHRAETDTGWTQLGFSGGATSLTCDLKKLENGAESLLGTAALTAGHYTQLRLVVQSATLYFDNKSEGPACAPTIAPPAGASAPVEVSSGEVRLNRQFTIDAAEATTITIDFDGSRSIHEIGINGYRMSPVISILSVQ